MEIQRPKSKQPIPEHAKIVFKGVLFDVYQWDQELFDGRKKIFEKVKRKADTVIVFAITDDGKIILNRQEQPGTEPFIGATGGGRIDEGEDILSTAKRELLEESGYEADKFILWDSQQPIKKVDWSVYTFIAKGIKKVKGLNLDGGEKVDSLFVSLDEFINIATTDKSFEEKEIIPYLFEAKLNPEKMKELKELFKPL